MSQPGSFGSIVPDPDWLVHKVQELERQIKELAAADPFAPMGIHPLAGATQFDGNVTSNGQLTANGLTVNGPAVIAGTLSLPAGIIDNDALQNPAVFGQSSTSATNFSIATSPSSVAAGSIAVPAGYSQAIVTVNASAGAVNSTSSADFLYIQAVINGSAANTMPGYAGPSSGWAWAGSTKTAVLTGLSGGSISLSALVQTQTGTWGANTSNRAYCEATAIFLR